MGVLLDSDDGGVVELTVLVGSSVDDGVELVVGDVVDVVDGDGRERVVGGEVGDVCWDDVVGEEVLRDVELEVCTDDDDDDDDVEVEGVLELVLLISAEVKNGTKQSGQIKQGNQLDDYQKEQVALTIRRG